MKQDEELLPLDVAIFGEPTDVQRWGREVVPLSEDLFTSVRPTLGERAGGFVGGIGQGVVEGALGGTLKGAGILTGISGLQAAGEAVSRFGESMLPGNPLARAGIPTKAGQAIGQGLGFMAPGGIAGKALKLGGAGRAGLIATQGALANGAAGYYDAKAAGADEGAAWESFLKNAAVGTTEVIPLAQILTRVDRATGGGLRRAALTALVEGAEEAAQESAQQLMGNLIAQELYDEERKLLEGVAEGGSLGAFAGVVLSALGSGAGRLAQVGREPQAGQAPTAGGPQAGRPPLTAFQAYAREVGGENLNLVGPATEAQRRTVERFAGLGVRAGFVSGAALNAPSALVAGDEALFRSDIPDQQLERRYVTHELAHVLRRQVQEEIAGIQGPSLGAWEALYRDLRELDPEGVQAAALDVEALYGRVTDDEVVSNYLEQIGYTLFDERLDAALAKPNLAVRILDTVLRALGLQGIQDRKLEALLQTAREKGVPKEALPEIRSAVEQAFEHLRRVDQAVGEGAPVVAETSEEKLTPKQAKRKRQKANKAKKRTAVAELPTEEGLFGEQERPAAARAQGPEAVVSAPSMFDEQPGDLPGQTSLLDVPRGTSEPPKPKLTPKERGRAARKKRVANAEDLHSFLRMRGGLRYEADFERVAEDQDKPKPGESRLIQKPGSGKGMPLDDAIELAIEAGFFPGADKGSLDPQEFRDALESNPLRDDVLQSFIEEEIEQAERERYEWELAEEDDAVPFARSAPEDIEQDLQLLSEERQWMQAVSTEGSRVRHDKEGWVGVVSRPAADPVNGLGEAGSVLVEKQDGETVEVSALALSPQFVRFARSLPLADAAKFSLRKWFTSAGLIPEDAFERSIAKDGWYNQHIQRTRNLWTDVERVAKPEDTDNIRRALRNPVALNMLRDELREPVRLVRDHIDELSSKMISDGVVEGKLAAHVDKGRGAYLRRSYQVFTDPKWAEKVPERDRNRAKAALRLEYPDATEQQIERKIESLLFEGKAADTPMAQLALLQGRGKLGSKDVTSLIRRKGLPRWLRQLYGEQYAPHLNYVESVTKMAQLISSHNFLKDMKNSQFFLKGEGSLPPDVGYPVVRIAADESNVMSPLNGYWTTPEIRDAFIEYYQTEPMPRWLQALLTVNGVSKYAKTVGSVMTQVRNFGGNVPFMVAQGHFGFAKDWRAGLGAVSVDFQTMNSRQWREMVLEAIRLGVLHEDVRAGELRDTVRETIGEASKIKRGIDFFTKLYQAGDNFWKIIAWRMEMQEGYSPEEAARIVRNTFPTYSLVPKAIKMLRRFPFTGPFVSFPWEVMRTSGNTIRLIRSELNSKEVWKRKRGARRLVGSLMAATLPGMAAMSARMLLGMSAEDDDKAREFLPPWSQNSNVLWLSTDADGRKTYVDLSYTDPYSVIKEPLTAFMRGEDWQESLVELGSSLLEPYASEEIATQAIIDAMRNKTRTGRKVYNEAGSPLERASEVAAHFYKAIEPGTLSSLNRIAKGVQGQVTNYGRAYDPTIEALAMTTGVRVSEMDVPQSVAFKAGDYSHEMGLATSILSTTAGRSGEVGDDEVREAYERTEKARRRLFRKMANAVHAARALGIPDSEIFEALDSRLSKEKAQDLMEGKYRPYRPSSSFLRTRSLDPEERKRRIQLIRSLYSDARQPLHVEPST